MEYGGDRICVVLLLFKLFCFIQRKMGGREKKKLYAQAD